MTYGVKTDTSQKLNLINSKTTWIFKFKSTMSLKQINIIQPYLLAICEQFVKPKTLLNWMV